MKNRSGETLCPYAIDMTGAIQLEHTGEYKQTLHHIGTANAESITAVYVCNRAHGLALLGIDRRRHQK